MEKLTIAKLKKNNLIPLFEFNNGVHHILTTYNISLYEYNEESGEHELIYFKKFPKDFNLPKPEVKEGKNEDTQYGPRYEGRFDYWDLNGTVPDNRKLFGKNYLNLGSENWHKKIKDLEGNLRLPAKVEWMHPDEPGNLMVFEFRPGYIQNNTYWNGFEDLLPQARHWFDKIVWYALTGYWEDNIEGYERTYQVGRVAIDMHNEGRNVYYN